MKLQVVKIDKRYVAISDEHLKIGDTILYGNPEGKEDWNWGFNIINSEERLLHYSKMKEMFDTIVPISSKAKPLSNKIIATDTSFKLEGIPQFELEKEDFIELAEAQYPYVNTSIEEVNKVHNTKVDSKRIAFIQDYRAAQKRGCYSIEDIQKAIGFGKDLYEDIKRNIRDGEERKLFTSDFIKSLNQPKKLVAIEVATINSLHSFPTEAGKNEPLIIINNLYPNGVLTIKQYYYEQTIFCKIFAG